MSNLFRVHKVADTLLPAYFIESAAPNNVEETLPPLPSVSGLTPLDPDVALDEIAAYLLDVKAPELVFTVHGFNNPPSVVLKRYRQAFQFVSDDLAIDNTSGLVCIGYRWPSEQCGWPKNTLWSAAPALLQGLFWTAIVCFFLSVLFALAANSHPVLWARWLHHLSYLLFWLFLAVPLTVIVLRIIVYFRDGYRASSYGVPDLVEVIRQLDLRLAAGEMAAAKTEGRKQRQNRVKLSFIGHSMGGFVVTSAIRILSDVFSPAAIHGAAFKRAGALYGDDALNGDDAINGAVSPRAGSPAVSSAPRADEDLPAPARTVAELVMQNVQREDSQPGRIVTSPEKMGGLDAGIAGKAPTSAIGNAFALVRLILVSPDIPAEALMSRRANFLASSLMRFEEAYLFSNEGDEVLRQVSTVANYFSFPTRSRKNGFRLGNTEVLADQYGLTNLAWLQNHSKKHPGMDASGEFLSNIRIGQLTLQKLYDQFGDKNQVQSALPQVFTYFDCTDYREDGKGILTWAKAKDRPRRTDQMSGWDHFWLLLTYARGNPDVHSGYFDAPFSRSLIYRLACLGFADTVVAVQNDVQRENNLLQERNLGQQAVTTPAPPAVHTFTSPLDQFSQACAKKQIKVLLSPRAYEKIL